MDHQYSTTFFSSQVSHTYLRAGAYYQSTLLYQALCTCMTGVTAFSCSRMPDSDTSSDRQLDFSLGQISGIQIGTSIMMDNDESMVPSPLVLVSVKRAINQANRMVTGTADGVPVTHPRYPRILPHSSQWLGMASTAYR